MKPAIIEHMIYEIRGQKVMLDFDVAAVYQVTTKALNQAVKRNIARFPKELMFRLTKKEWLMRSQNVTASQKRRNINVAPYAFTEHGVTMLATVLKSERAIKMSLAIIKVFITLKNDTLNYKALAERIETIRGTVRGQGEQLNQIFKVLESMMVERQKKRTWDERERIGFKTSK